MSDNTSTPNRRRAGPGVTVKICGITNQTDALKAIDLGADALGFNLFTGSKRFIEFERNAEWIAPLRSSIATVAVLVNPTADEAIRVAQLGVFEWLQLHGNESPELCRSLVEAKIPFIKAIPVTETTSAEEPAVFGTRTILLDSLSERGFGGSGYTLPWPRARQFIEAHPELHVILAGGLTAQNVAEAINIVRPAGVDVTSGVEAAPGHKDFTRLQAFIAAVKSA